MPSAQASDRRGAAQPRPSAVWPGRASGRRGSYPRRRASRAAIRASSTVSPGCTQAPQWRVPKARTTSAEAGSRPRKGYRQSTKKAASPEVAFSIRCDHVRSCSIVCFAGRRPVALCCCLAGESVRGASPSRVKTVALRLISAHLRPQEAGSKPKVTQLRGQRPVVAAHNAVALRQRRLTVARRHPLGFIIHQPHA